MKQEYRKIIDEILVDKITGGIECPRDFNCTKFAYEDICKAEDIGKDDCLECLEKNRCDCPFVIDIGYARLCRCPLRIYIAKKMNK